MKSAMKPTGGNSRAHGNGDGGYLCAIDMFDLNIRKTEPRDVADLSGKVPEDELKIVAASWASGTFSFTENNEAIGILGMSLSDGGVGTIWLVISDELRAHKYFLHRQMKQIIAGILNDAKINRLDALVKIEDGRACEWWKRLGFIRGNEVLDGYVIYSVEA